MLSRLLDEAARPPSGPIAAGAPLPALTSPHGGAEAKTHAITGAGTGTRVLTTRTS